MCAGVSLLASAGMATSQPYLFVFGSCIPSKPGEQAMVSLKPLDHPANLRSTTWKVKTCTSSVRNADCAAPIKIAFLATIGEASPEEALRRDVRQTRLALLKGEKAPGSGTMQLVAPLIGSRAPMQRGQSDEFLVEVCATTLATIPHVARPTGQISYLFRCLLILTPYSAPRHVPTTVHLSVYV
jgi:hypothetical protein